MSGLTINFDKSEVMVLGYPLEETQAIADRLNYRLAGGGEQLRLAEVRDQLIREEDSIVFALIERAKRPRNTPAYSAAAAAAGSLAEFFVREAEVLHAKASLVPS
ncbi:unnamed protein product [Triticum turgidum subsp. durum]|uniref:chorismate mutase n=1 Tax=Triticum turgidum subsp. durum TaxID=4567 RepID=A0A9R0XWP7_TRITD|nr:unnamed protein product [Triticum turgidum subsp. durum]